MFNNYDTDGAICPYCNHLSYASDSDGLLYDEGLTEYECGDCGHTFAVAAHVQWSWTSAVKDEHGPRREVS